MFSSGSAFLGVDGPYVFRPIFPADEVLILNGTTTVVFLNSLSEAVDFVGVINDVNVTFLEFRIQCVYTIAAADWQLGQAIPLVVKLSNGQNNPIPAGVGIDSMNIFYNGAVDAKIVSNHRLVKQALYQGLDFNNRPRVEFLTGAGFGVTTSVFIEYDVHFYMRPVVR